MGMDNFTLLRIITGGLSAYIQEDKVLYDALRDRLQRDPEIGDLGKCIMRFWCDSPNEYVFAYEDVVLGKVKREIRMDRDFNSDTAKLIYEVLFYPIKRKLHD